jgi:deoxycytidylate deaminase
MTVSRRGLPLLSPAGPGEGPELVFAITAALGTDLGSVADALANSLRRVDYDARTIHVAKLLHDLVSWRGLPEEPHDARIESLQDAGNDFRRKMEHGGAMALLATAAIRAERERLTKDAKRPVSRCAYVLRSLKHPEEVRTLRRIYGPGCFLIAAYSPHGRRVDRLAEKIARSRHSARTDSFRDRAEWLIQRDQAEPENPYGQNVSTLFPMADVFVNVENPEGFRQAIERFVDLIFGRPFITPTRDEYAMFHARAAALRSADPSRQVGAVIATADGDVIAVGSNEVPKAGGGMYWAGDSPDLRDFQLPEDPGQGLKNAMLGEVLDTLRRASWLSNRLRGRSTAELTADALPLVRGTQLMGVGEFGRTVHAEMAALIDAARRGVSVRGQTLYTTTFPCHNCTKHLIAAGIDRVVYVEPYPKSRAKELHLDAIVVEAGEKVVGKVAYEAFVGIAPRQYVELFSAPPRVGAKGDRRPWIPGRSSPRFVGDLIHFAYLENERIRTQELAESMKTAGLKSTPKNTHSKAASRVMIRPARRGRRA